MAGNIRPLRRRLRLTKGRLVGRMTQEKQKLSFFLVIFFLVIFGLIVLAEVLFMEDGKGEIFDEEPPSSNNNNNNRLADLGAWETPKPLLPAVHRELSSDNDYDKNNKFKSEKLKESLRRHQEEMERLIKNISARINRRPTSSPPPKPYNYENEVKLDFDFALEKHTGFDAQWQPVNGTRHKFYVYSAYYDARQPQRPLIRVIGATKTKQSDKVWCRMYYRKEPSSSASNQQRQQQPFEDSSGDEEEPPLVVPAGITIIRENWNLKFTACFVLCALPVPANENEKVRVPESVSIVVTTTAEASNQLPVINHDVGTGSYEVNATEVGVCVKPMHFHYNKTLELIEFLELNKILGVTKFTLYNDTVSPDVSCVLEHYMSEGSVVVLPWKLNIDSQTEIRTEGLFAALNDCLYRNMNDFRYLMLTDFDEFIVPHVNDTLPDMLTHIDTQKIVVTGNGGGYGRKVPPQPKLTSAYSFQNAFFYLQFPDDQESQNGPALRVLRKTRRKSKFNPQKQRSKYICIPRNVKEAGNHFIWEFARGYNLNVPTSYGYLHHYRVCEFGGDDCIHTESHVDRTMYRYRDLLLKNVDKVVQKLSNRCQLERLHSDLTPLPEATAAASKS
jgi:hypothetical protein